MKLTKKEREVLPFYCLPKKEIAKRLGVSIGTVNTHIAHISYKIHYHPNRMCVLLEALKQGIITLDEIVTE